MPDARPEVVEDVPELVETTPPPPAPIAEQPAPAPAPAPAPVAAAPTDRPVPLPDQSPAPDYPPAALRRGESGTVVVQVEVDARGQPLDAKVIQRSGSRDLDRAALDAVRGWRFQPAQSNGQPMQGTLEIPFDFKPAQ
ncbi:Gram-negative bacterial tonB protein [compost metagenome]